VKAFAGGGSGLFAGSRRCWLGPRILVLLLLAASAAVAGEPIQDPAAIPGTICRLTLFNDSLNSGIGAAAALFGYDNMDGDDEGFTHGFELAVERLATTGVTGVWALGSRLYTRRTSEQADEDPGKDVPVWFTEEESLSYIVDTRRRRDRTFVEYGGGVLYDAKTYTSVGASGQ